MKEKWFQEFGITEYDRNYFYCPDNYDRVKKILSKEPEDVLFERIQRLETERNALAFDLHAISDSVSFKIGRGITALPRKIMSLLK